MSTDIAGDRNRFAQQLFTSLPQRYDRLAEVLSMGQNGRWRRAMIDRVVPTSPGKVLDVASGTAGVALQLAARTSADIVGVDLTEGMLARASEMWPKPDWANGSSWLLVEPNNCRSPTAPSTP